MKHHAHDSSWLLWQAVMPLQHKALGIDMCVVVTCIAMSTMAWWYLLQLLNSKKSKQTDQSCVLNCNAKLLDADVIIHVLLLVLKESSYLCSCVQAVFKHGHKAG